MINKAVSILLVLCPLLIVMILLDALQSANVMAAPDDMITVDTLIDEFDESCIDGDCSLRDAIYVASDGDKIDFSINGTIDISVIGELVIQDNLTIDGDNEIVITGKYKSRVFRIGYYDNTADVILNGLIISEGLNLTNWNCGVPCGGGIYVDKNSILTLTHSSILSSTGFLGGGIYNLGGTVTISNSNLSGNSANYSEYSIGGAIYNSGNEGSTALIIVDSTLSGNSASKDGGGIFNVGAGNSAIVTIINSTFSNNMTDNNGGGIYNILGSGYGSSAVVTISNSTFSGNSANNDGGAIYNNDGSVTINNSTITNNYVGNSSGGIHSNGNASTSTTLAHTIAAGNFISGTNSFNDLALSYGDSIDSFHSGGHNLIGTIYDPFTSINAFDQPGDQVGVDNPKLDPLANYGGVTFTHDLQSDSSAIDTGDCANGPATDQRGMPRPQNDTCDIGAVELVGEYHYVYLPMVMRPE